MQLFLRLQVQQLATAKWGTTEPYIVALTEFTKGQRRWLLEDPNRFKELSPEKFQYFLADRFEAMGLSVQLAGNVYRPDGGIDLIAYPDPGKCAFPFLIAVQSAHHRTDSKTDVRKVRDFVGAYSGDTQPFRIGVIATNTTFTCSAENYAHVRQHILRLRDLRALVRWLQDDFVNKFEWQEIPESIELGGFRIPLINWRGRRVSAGSTRRTSGTT
jgi:hypothetical protein